MESLCVNGKDLSLQLGDLSEEEMRCALRASSVAWDIETSGLDWRTERICTCQLDIPERGLVIVRLGKEKPDHMCSLLKEPRVKKVFHHAMFDLRFMSYNWGVNPQNVACTKIASKLLDVRNKRKNTLKSLLRHYLGVRIDKSQRVSDWTSRELTAKQLSYGAKDVMYLLRLLTKLESELESEGILELARLCFDHIPTRVELDIGGYQDVYKY